MNKLVASCLEGKFHLYDLRTQHPKKGFAQLTEKVIQTKILFFRNMSMRCMFSLAKTSTTS